MTREDIEHAIETGIPEVTSASVSTPITTKSIKIVGDMVRITVELPQSILKVEGDLDEGITGNLVFMQIEGGE